VVFAQRNCLLVETRRERDRGALVVLIALIIALLLAAPASAQVFPIPPTAQHVICDSGCGSPPANPDGSTFTAGVSNVSLVGAAFDDAVADLIAGTYGSPRLTAKRAFHVNLRTAAGVEIGTITTPVYVNCSVGCAAGTPGQTTMANSSPVVVASDQSAIATTNAIVDAYAPLIFNNLNNATNSNNQHIVDIGSIGGVAQAIGTGEGAAGTNTMRVTLSGKGQATMANSNPVVISSNQSAVPVSGPIALSAGAAVIGHVIADTGSTTAVTGNVTVVQPTATNLNAAVVGTGTAGSPAGNILTIQGVAAMTKLLVTPDSVALPANQSVNVAQIAGTNTVTGGVAGIIAVGGNVANAVAATANPVPVGGIFTTTPATLTTGQTATMQFTAAQNLKHDITTIAGTVPTTAGKLDVKGADGDVFVRQATAANLNAAVVGTGTAGAPAGNILTIQGVAAMTKLLVTPDSVALPANQSVNVAQIAGTNTVTAAAGVQKVGIVGNANAAFDAANNSAMPANEIAVGLLAATIDTSPTAATAGNLRSQLASTEGVTYVQEGGPKRFSCFVASTATVTTQCQAAPGAGLRAYITSALITDAVGTAQSVDIVFGTGAACVTGITALTNKVFFVGATQQGSLNQSITFATPLVPTAANAICLRPTAGTAFGGTITGYIAP
jgi:hypothetical protein